MSYRIAVLLTNTDDSAFARRHPDDARKVVALLQPVRPDWRFECFDAKAGALPPAPARFDAEVITGSIASVNDPAPWIDALAARIARLHAERRTMVGLCFGHQLIARVLGGRVGPNPGGLRVGVAETRFGPPEPWMRPPLDMLALFAAHEEQVLDPPPGARVLGTSPHCPVASLAIDAHVFTTQYHPELRSPFVREMIDAFAPEFGPQVVARALGEIGRPVDADVFAQWIAHFVEHPRERA